MAGNRFWSVRYSAMMVVRFDSDQPRSAPRGGRGPSSEPVSAGGPGRAASPGQRVWLAGPWRSRHGYRARYRGRLHGMASRPAGADYPCWNLNIAYLRNPQWIQKNIMEIVQIKKLPSRKLCFGPVSVVGTSEMKKSLGISSGIVCDYQHWKFLSRNRVRSEILDSRHRPAATWGYGAEQLD